MKSQAGKEPEQAQGVEKEAGESRAVPACEGNSWESPSPPLSDPQGFKTQGPNSKMMKWDYLYHSFL